MIVGVVVAHPDDEVLGCGGTIARLALEHDVHLAILGEGINSRFKSVTADAVAELEMLHNQARAVANLLGMKSVELCGFPDNRFDELPLLDVVQRMERWLGDVRPGVVYTHHPGDLNIDHMITFRAALTATRPVIGQTVRDLYSFEVPSSTEWSFQRLQPEFRPTVFVDISATLDLKLQAMELYTGEVRVFPHPRSPEALRAIAHRWGTIAGLECAEAFELIRSVR